MGDECKPRNLSEEFARGGAHALTVAEVAGILVRDLVRERVGRPCESLFGQELADVAGLRAGLTICEAVLRTDPSGIRKKKGQKRRPKAKLVFRELQKARDKGYAWLLEHFSVRSNLHHHGFGFHYYYLYGIERACEIGQVALIGDRDWYFAGATMLMSMQSATDGFEMATLYANCFAVLFLKQAAPPLPVMQSGRINDGSRLPPATARQRAPVDWRSPTRTASSARSRPPPGTRGGAPSRSPGSAPRPSSCSSDRCRSS